MYAVRSMQYAVLKSLVYSTCRLVHSPTVFGNATNI
jgi:hypothetical protein